METPIQATLGMGGSSWILLNDFQVRENVLQPFQVEMNVLGSAGQNEYTKTAHYITPVKKNVLGPSEAYTEEDYSCCKRGEGGFIVKVCAYNRKVYCTFHSLFSCLTPISNPISLPSCCLRKKISSQSAQQCKIAGAIWGQFSCWAFLDGHSSVGIEDQASGCWGLCCGKANAWCSRPDSKGDSRGGVAVVYF